MIKKMMALLGATVLSGSLLAVATPQTADAASNYTTAWKCVGYRDIVTCAYPEWRRQDDGAGVTLEGFEVWTSQGCGSLEDGGKYDPVQALWVNPSNGNIDYNYNFGVEGCNFYKDLSNRGRDNGGMDFRLSLRARIDWATDKDVYIGWNLQANGTYTVTYAFSQDV